MWGKSKQVDISGTLKDERAISEIILDSIDDGMVLIDGQGIIRKFNPAAAKITGWKQAEAAELDWKLVLKFTDSKGEAVDSAATAIGKAANSGQPERDNAANLTSKSGNSISIAISSTPLGKNDGSQPASAVVAVFRDVTLERQEENQRAEFISTASHEMRTPVAAIEGYLSLALNNKVASVDDRARDYLSKAYKSTQHLGQLFQDLLTSARAEDGRLTSRPVVVEIGQFLEQLTEELKFAADKKGLGVEFSFGSGQTIDATSKVVIPLFYTIVDPDRLKEVVTNLFDNAVKYTPEGKISIGLTGDESTVQLYVRDTGMGIPREDLQHLFQKFYRVDNSATRSIGGTGLGLFISRKIVELYKGQIWADSNFGQGSTFFINLPRISAEKAESAKKQQSAQETVLAPQSD